jgi:predicted membrane chloride channel (bestrophin family)
MQTKNWWESKAVWGLIVIAFAQVARAYGHTLSDADQTVLIQALSELGTAAGTILSTWGTLTRTTTIKQMAPPNQLLALLAASVFFTGCASNQSV